MVLGVVLGVVLGTVLGTVLGYALPWLTTLHMRLGRFWGGFRWFWGVVVIRNALFGRRRRVNMIARPLHYVGIKP